MRFLKIDKNNIQKITKLILVFLFTLFILFPNSSKATISNSILGMSAPDNPVLGTYRECYSGNCTDLSIRDTGFLGAVTSPTYVEAVADSTLSANGYTIGINLNNSQNDSANWTISYIETGGKIISTETGEIDQSHIKLDSPAGQDLISSAFAFTKTTDKTSDVLAQIDNLKADVRRNNLGDLIGTTLKDPNLNQQEKQDAITDLRLLNQKTTNQSNPDSLKSAGATPAQLAVYQKLLNEASTKNNGIGDFFNSSTPGWTKGGTAGSPGGIQNAAQNVASLQAASTAAANKPIDNGGQCFDKDWQIWPKNCLIIGLYYAIFWPLSWLVGIAGWIFNFVFTQTVINMAAGIAKVGAIDVAWKTMRDLANIGFIFILLWLAISTILGAGEHDVKKTLSKLIIVAVLLNFSLFFTKIIIDAANILAISFFNAIAVGGPGSSGTGATGLGDAFMAAFRLQSLYSITAQAGTNGNAVAASNNSATILIGGSIAMLVAIVILLASLMMFIKRYVILILVMIFSPLAFAGMVLHQTEHSVHEWWNYLLKEAFFAPMFMILLWISFTIINDTHFLQAIGENAANNASIPTPLSAGITATDNGTTGTGTEAQNSPAGVLLNFMIVSAFLIASLVVAEKMGVAGASGAMNFAKSAQAGIQGGALGVAGWAGMHTVGRLAHTIGNKGSTSEFLQDARAGKLGNNFASRFMYKRIGQAGLGITSSLSSAKFGGQVSADDKVKSREQEFKDYLEEHHYSADAWAHVMKMGANATGGNYSNDKKAVHNLIHGMSAGQIADAQIALDADKEKGRASNALGMLTADHAKGGRLTQEMERTVLTERRKGRAGDLENILKQNRELNNPKLTADEKEVKRMNMLESFKKMETGQKKFVLENMTGIEADQMKAHTGEMMDILREADTAAIESIYKSPRATKAIIGIAGKTAVSSAMRKNLKEAYSQATDAEKDALNNAWKANKNDNPDGKGIDEMIVTESDDTMAELWNKNGNRYVKPSTEQGPLLEAAKKISKKYAEAQAAQKQAEAVTKQTVSLVKSVSDMLRGGGGDTTSTDGGGI